MPLWQFVLIVMWTILITIGGVYLLAEILIRRYFKRRQEFMTKIMKCNNLKGEDR